MLLGYFFELVSSLYATVVVLGYLSLPWVYDISRYLIRFPNLSLSDPSMKEHTRDASLEIIWTLLVFYRFAPRVSRVGYHSGSANTTTNFLVLNFR